VGWGGIDSYEGEGGERMRNQNIRKKKRVEKHGRMCKTQLSKKKCFLKHLVSIEILLIKKRSGLWLEDTIQRVGWSGSMEHPFNFTSCRFCGMNDHPLVFHSILDYSLQGYLEMNKDEYIRNYC
jgi:hypothetical protein